MSDTDPAPEGSTVDEPAALAPEPSTVRLSPEVAAFLTEVVNTIQLPAAAPNFAEQAALIVAAKTQLEGPPS